MNRSAYDSLQQGGVIPAMPLALTSARRFDERRQRGLIRYYAAAGVDGLAVGVHTTQFEIREPRHKLYQPVLSLAAEELTRADRERQTPLVRIAGACGLTPQAVAEAALARDLGYQAVLLSLAAWRGASSEAIWSHCREVAQVVPLVGFHLQEAVGGIPLPYSFWRRFVEIENVVAIKVAPFDRYLTSEVVRAVADSGRTNIALYTGNDDHIVLDLLTPYRFLQPNQKTVELRFVGGLLGHWAVWTQGAVKLFQRCRIHATSASPVSAELMATANAVTDCNAAFFDAANHFRGCIPGIHEVLRRQGLLEGVWCLDESLFLSAGQAEAIDRVCQLYPELNDDDFVSEHRDEWLS